MGFGDHFLGVKVQGLQDLGMDFFGLQGLGFGFRDECLRIKS